MEPPLWGIRKGKKNKQDNFLDTVLPLVANSFTRTKYLFFFLIGCKNASEEAKKKIMTELMKNDKIGTEIRKAIEKTKPTN